MQRAASDVSTELTLADAQQNLNAAKQRVVDADAAVVKANRAVESAVADRDDANQSIADAQQAVADASVGLTNAQTELDATRLKPAPTIPAGNGSFQIDVEGARQAVKQAEAAVTSANAGVRTAQAQVRSAQRAATRASQAIDDSRAAVDSAVFAATQARESSRIAELRFRQAQLSPGGGSPSADSGSMAAAAPSLSAATPGPPSATGVVGGVATGGVASGSGSTVDASSGSASAPLAGSGVGSNAPASGGGPGAVTVSQAQATLDQAKAQLTIAQAELDQANKSAGPTKETAQGTIRAADVAVRIAVAQRAELFKPADLVALRSLVASAMEEKTRADADLVKLQAETGVTVPANEVVFVDGLPLRIDDTKLVAGDALSGAFMTVASKRLAVDASVDPADASSLRTGQDAEIEATDLGISLPAKVTKIATQTGTNGVEASRIYVELTPTETTEVPDVLPATTVPADGGFVSGPVRTPRLQDLNGLSVKVTIPISTTDGNVLVVPTPAVSAAPDGSTRVEVETDPLKPTTFVNVTAGLRADGYVQITPTTAGSLKPGDLVVTGNRNGKQLQGTPGPNDQSGGDQPADVTAETSVSSAPLGPLESAPGS